MELDHSQSSPPQPNSAPAAPGLDHALLRRARRTGTMVSPWAQRYAAQTSPPRPAGVTTRATQRLLQRIDKPQRGTVWRPNVGSLKPGMTDSFTGAIYERVTYRPIAINQPRQEIQLAESPELLFAGQFAPVEPAAPQPSPLQIPRFPASATPSPQPDPKPAASKKSNVPDIVNRMLESKGQVIPPAPQTKKKNRPAKPVVPPNSRLFSRVQESAVDAPPPALQPTTSGAVPNETNLPAKPDQESPSEPGVQTDAEPTPYPAGETDAPVNGDTTAFAPDETQAKPRPIKPDTLTAPPPVTPAAFLPAAPPPAQQQPQQPAQIPPRPALAPALPAETPRQALPKIKPDRPAAPMAGQLPDRQLASPSPSPLVAPPPESTGHPDTPPVVIQPDHSAPPEQPMLPGPQPEVAPALLPLADDLPAPDAPPAVAPPPIASFPPQQSQPQLPPPTPAEHQPDQPDKNRVIALPPARPPIAQWGQPAPTLPPVAAPPAALQPDHPAPPEQPMLPSPQPDVAPTPPPLADDLPALAAPAPVAPPPAASFSPQQSRLQPPPAPVKRDATDLIAPAKIRRQPRPKPDAVGVPIAAIAAPKTEVEPAPPPAGEPVAAPQTNFEPTSEPAITPQTTAPDLPLAQNLLARAAVRQKTPLVNRQRLLTARQEQPATPQQARTHLIARGWRFKTAPTADRPTAPGQIRRATASLEGSQSAGQPLAEGPRTTMEGALQRDFSGVRIHRANLSGLNVQAATRGQDVFIDESQGDDEFERPESLALLGHELTHVSQSGVAQTKPASQVQRQPLADLPVQRVAADEAAAESSERTVLTLARKQDRSTPPAAIYRAETTPPDESEEFAGFFSQGQADTDQTVNTDAIFNDLQETVESLLDEKLSQLLGALGLETGAPASTSRLDALAQQILPYVKQLITVERERRS